MDTLSSIKLASNISRFVGFAAGSLLTLQSLDASNNQIRDIHTKLTTQVLEYTNEAQFQLPNGASSLSPEDDVLFRLSQECESASSALTSYIATLYQGDGQAGQGKSVEDITPILQSIRESLETKYLPLAVSSIGQTVLEIGAKNNRLKANRTEDISHLAADLNMLFQESTSPALTDTQNSRAWAHIALNIKKILDYAAEQVLLGSLQFWTMNTRQEQISKEHENTFEWILSDQNSKSTSRPTVNFVEWLSKDEHLYWISGKPGSGKSTVMKHVVESPKTLEKLNAWAGGDTLVTASFYFWSSAKDPLQKSDTGLLRSILFQVLRQCPGLIAQAFPEQWQEYQLHGSQRFLNITDSTTSELLSAYRIIARLLSSVNAKFCFFIDGLDEYDGQPADIIELVEAISHTPNLKACISSRQWKEFEASFGGSNPWKLYVHQLTQVDMELYANDLLSGNEKLERIQQLDGKECFDVFVKCIVDNAQGVFLWVFLVIRALIDELIDTDRLIDLQQKLDSIPTNLENYFEKILLDTDEAAWAQTAHILQTTLLSAEKLPLMAYWFMEELSTSRAIMATELRRLSRDVASERLEEAAKLLNTYSKGLLKINNGIQFLSPALNEQEWLYGFRVDFLHRTVADFLQTAQMQQLLKKRSSTTFDADLSICKACLAIIQITPASNDMFAESSRALSILHIFWTHAKLLDRASTRDLQISLLDKMISTLKQHSNKLVQLPMVILGAGNYWAYDSDFEFAMLFHCVSYGLGEYVQSRLEEERLEFSMPISGLLSGCLSFDPRVRTGKLTLSLETLRALLQRGLNPNVPFGDRSFSWWQSLLTTMYSRHLRGLVTQNDFDAIELSSQYGADLQAMVEVFSRSRVDGMQAADILDKILPKEQFLALRVREEHRTHVI
ncbi:hypothetical protein EJ08DRAFT_654397 [Tothia fuscella]|uniref:NACHT domain-containing protein n=1 Tax=Tothia fuscella TaxID=1048955 RepID=A0A9P4TT01_9PEZI|nr:hypothetical protein EJ08DRAFT_654397 [Tothia fuscella]